MSRPVRMISPEEVRNVIEQGEIIEDYPYEKRNSSITYLLFPFFYEFIPGPLATVIKGCYLIIALI
ncbi:MAG: DUF4258 domain-containing protein [Deltaproteobacteria bacterium]|jgi:hypothetical protein|nr:DUF4258 domain-containing protein [Deltaproteobacteria bacterium]MDL1986143.1 DUF4258 domain-containing protein [Deltaproteobacteria bacterium]